MASQKRTFDKLSDIDDPQNNADIHVAVQNITPIKKAKSGVDYFDGYVTDGSRRMRLVGFDGNLQTTLSSFADTKSPVMMEKCQIKRGRTDELEILLSSSSKIKPSPKKLDFSASASVIRPSSMATAAANDAQLYDVQTIDDGIFVNVVAKVISVKPAKPVSTGLVQELIVTDGTCELKLSVWDDNIGKFQQSNTYNFFKVAVRSFRNEKTLMMTRQSSYEEIHSSCVAVQSQLTSNDIVTVTNFHVIGVQNFIIQYSCVKCSSKLTDMSTLSRCPNCKVLQILKSASLNTTINIYISTQDDNKIMLTAYTPTILNLLQCCNERVNLEELEVFLLTKCPASLKISYDEQTFEIHSID